MTERILRRHGKTMLLAALAIALAFAWAHMNRYEPLGDRRGGAVEVWDRWLHRTCINERTNASTSGFKCLDRDRLHERALGWAGAVVSESWSRVTALTRAKRGGKGDAVEPTPHPAAEAYIDSLTAAGTFLTRNATDYIKKHGPPPTRLARLRWLVAQHEAETACRSQPDVTTRLLCEADTLDSFFASRGWVSQ